MNAETGKLRFQILLEEFLADREWQDELEVDVESKTVMLRTGVNVASHGGGVLVIEASDVTEMVGVFLYLPFNCKGFKIAEMKQLLNDINIRRNYGCFQCIPDGDNGRVRWVHRVDFEGGSPTAKSLHQIVGPGWDTAAEWADVIAAVAITKQTAEEALEEFDEEQRQRQEAEDNGPSEL
jgi:hypothetical protein